MDERLKQLLTLQRIDIEIRNLDKEASAHPKRLEEIDADLATHRTASDERTTELDEAESAKAKIEAQIQAHKDQIRKWESRLTDIKTPREYAALSREIDIAKKGIRNQEEDVLGYMEQGEALKNEIERIERDLLESEKGYENERNELQSKIATSDVDRAKLEERRKVAAEPADRRLLTSYERIRARRGGIAMAAAPEGLCGECHVKVRPQPYQDLVTGKAGILQCESCNRILYIPENDEGAPDAATA